MTAALHHVRAAFHDPSARVYQVVQGGIWALILLSIVSLVLEAMLPDGSRARGFPYPTGSGIIICAPAIADLNRDGE